MHVAPPAYRSMLRRIAGSFLPALVASIALLAASAAGAAHGHPIVDPASGTTCDARHDAHTDAPAGADALALCAVCLSPAGKDALGSGLSQIAHPPSGSLAWHAQRAPHLATPWRVAPASPRAPPAV